MNEKDNKVFEEEINLTRLFKDIYERRWIYSSLLIFIGVISALFLKSIPNEYVTNSVVSIKESSSSNSMSGSLNGLGSALNPFNVFGSSMSSSRKGYVLRLLQSRNFFEYFVKQDNLFLVELHAFKSYDNNINENLYEEDIYNEENSTWNPDYFIDNSPSLLLSHKKFLNYFSIEEKESLDNYLTLKVQHESPIIAKKWLENLISSFNTYVMEMEAEQANLSLKYLNSVIAETNVPEVKGVIANLIKSQIKDLMITNVNDEYVLKIIDKPYMPEKKSYPNRLLYLIVIIFLSLFIFFIFSLIFPKKK